MEATFLGLLLDEAPAEAFEQPLAEARRRGATHDELETLQRAAMLALQLRATLAERRRRERELAALYETASDLSSIRDVGRVLRAIVRRARQLLGADTAYLTLIDEAAGDTSMRVTEGTVGTKFPLVRLPLGVGLGGLVAQRVRPSFTSNYLEDPRFDHERAIDSAVADEGIVAILGVPMLVNDQVIGVLFAADRSERHFTPDDVNLLSSLAAHAAIVIENTRLFEEATQAVADLNTANAALQEHTDAVERAAAAHERFTAIVLGGGGMADVAAALATVMQGRIEVVDAGGTCLAVAGDDGDGTPLSLDLALAGRRARDAGRAVEMEAGGGPAWVTPVVAGSDHLGSLVCSGPAALDGLDRRTLERAAQVAALLLLNERASTDAAHRVRGEFLEDLVRNAARDPDTLHRRARRLGVDLTAPHAVAVMSAPTRRAVVHAAQAVVDRRGGLAGELAGTVVVLVPTAEAADAVAALHEAVPRDVVATVGGAGPATGPEAVVDAYHDADRVRRALLGLDREGHATTVGELGVYALLFSEAGRRELATFVDRLLGPVLRYDARRGTDLVTTLRTFFDEGGNVTRVGARLHVHPNTVYQRLDRVGGLIDRDVRDPVDALDLHLALRIHGLRSAI